jgi:hypothetical protein
MLAKIQKEKAGWRKKNLLFLYNGSNNAQGVVDASLGLVQNKSVRSADKDGSQFISGRDVGHFNNLKGR